MMLVGVKEFIVRLLCVGRYALGDSSHHPAMRVVATATMGQKSIVRQNWILEFTVEANLRWAVNSSS